MADENTTNTESAESSAPEFGTPEYTDWYYNDPSGPGYAGEEGNAESGQGSEQSVTESPSAGTPAPEFGTPEYTEWYYNDPAGPGYVEGSNTSVEVNRETGDVNVVDNGTGNTVVWSAGKVSGVIDQDVVVIGTSPTTGEVLVKNMKTGDEYWKPGTPEQIAEVSSLIENSGDKRPASNPVYQLPQGVFSSGQPVAGTLTEKQQVEMKNLEDKWSPFIKEGVFHGTEAQYQEYLKENGKSLSVYTDRGDSILVSLENMNKIASLHGEDQFRAMVGMGIVQDGKFIPGDKVDNWGYIPQWQIDRINNPTQSDIDRMFDSGKKSGEIPDNAVLMGWNKDSRSLEYAELPPGAVFKGYDKTTGKVSYELPRNDQTTVLPLGFIGPPAPNEIRAIDLFDDMKKSGVVPFDAVPTEYNPSTGEFKYSVPANPYSIGPSEPGLSRPNWFDDRVMDLESWRNKLSSDLDESYGNHSNTAARLGLTALGGLAMIGIDTITSIPILAGKIAAHPTDTPGIVYDVGKGMVLHIGNTAYNILSNKYTKDIMSGDMSKIVYDSGMSYLIISGAGKGAKEIADRITTYIAPRGVPEGTLVKEISTGRIPIGEGDLAKSYAEAMNKVEMEVSRKGGKWTGNVPIEGTPYELRYVKTPVQKVVGDVLFHGTKTEVDAAGAVTKESLLKVAEKDGKVTAGKGGLYTDPWAAIGYTRGGKDPGLLMVLTDASKIKSGAAGLAKGATQSDKFVTSAKPGFYGTSKVWKGDMETEIVGAPGTKVNVPSPKADLVARTLAGKYSDFFTYDNGKFVPIKIGLDSKSFKSDTAKRIDNPATWYAVKIASLQGALITTAEAMKHPGLVLKDVSGIVKEMADIERFFREGTGSKGRGQLPGVRDVYLVQTLGSRIREISSNLISKALGKTRDELPRVSENSNRFKDAFERNLEDAYRESADSIIRSFSDVSKGYARDSSTRHKFEDAYLTEFTTAAESVAKSSEVESEVKRMIDREISNRPVSEEEKRSVSEFSELVRSNSPTSEESGDTGTAMPSTGSSRKETADISRVEPRKGTSSARSGSISTSISTIVPRSGTTGTAGTRGTGGTGGHNPTPSSKPGGFGIVTTPLKILVFPDNKGSKTGNIPIGSVAWKQGSFWKYIPPPYNADKPITLRKGQTPIGARFTDRNTPSDTVQVIGQPGALIPKLISVDLGETDIFIKDGNKIEFGGRGNSTNVGTRIDSNLVGMSLGESIDIGEPILKESTYKRSAVQKRSKKHRISNYEYMTTLVGFKP